jgi:hypothetical protein
MLLTIALVRVESSDLHCADRLWLRTADRLVPRGLLLDRDLDGLLVLQRGALCRGNFGVKEGLSDREKPRDWP